jgi:hypothetical protein
MITGFDRTEKSSAYQTLLRAEIEHLKHGMDGQRSLLQRSFIWLLVLVALIAFVWRVVNTIPQQPSLLYWLLNEFHFDITNYYSSGIHNIMTHIMLLFPLCVVIWDLWLMFQTLTMSANSIARERNGKSWELLLLTGVNARQIVRAKWWAVVHRQWRNYALLAIMRIGAISFLAMSFDVQFYFGRPPSFSYGSVGPVAEPHISTVFGIAVAIVLLSAALIAVLTMLNLMFTAACGIVGGIITPRSSLAVPSGIGVLLIVTLLVTILFAVPGYLVLKPDIENFGYYPDPVVSTVFLIFGLIGASMVDNGSIDAGLLMRFGYNVRWWQTWYGVDFFSDTLRGHGPAFLTALLLSIGIVALLMAILLWRAEKIIARQNV